jgi:hypothetical protein
MSTLRRFEIVRDRTNDVPSLPIGWAFEVRCVHCGERFAVDDSCVSAQVGVLDDTHRNRLFLVQLPNQCPGCKSLHAVTG